MVIERAEHTLMTLGGGNVAGTVGAWPDSFSGAAGFLTGSS